MDGNPTTLFLPSQVTGTLDDGGISDLAGKIVEIRLPLPPSTDCPRRWLRRFQIISAFRDIENTGLVLHLKDETA